MRNPRLALPVLLSIPFILTAAQAARASSPLNGGHTGAAASQTESARWQREAARVTILRDDWGIAHITGTTDADAVFGMIYAQAEDDFNRIETNYLNSMGRLAEAEGQDRIWQDLRMKFFIDPAQLKRLYATSPEWLKKLMDAWADGLNFYLSTHPAVKPRVIARFEPWMALSFTEGSIGGDIERVDLDRLEDFYGQGDHTGTPLAEQDLSDGADNRVQAHLFGDDPGQAAEKEPGGSNGVAIAPLNTAAHHSLLLINPHTSFFFRSELQMVSAEGLNVYGAVTWGQFFVYQGFNDRAGWMHTSSGVDAVDEYRETVANRNQNWSYRYGTETRPMVTREIAVPYKAKDGMAVRSFTVYYTSHGPVVRAEGGRWITIHLMQEPVKALEQSYLRTRARTYSEYRKTMELQANSSNNTIFADADGDIAYFHGNFIPRRDTRFDFTRPVDGSDPSTDWQGLMTVDQIPQLLNPKSGYLFNVNNWPWAGAGESSLRREDFPAWVETGSESARGLHAMRVLSGKHDFTLNSLIAAAYDSYLPWFERPVPALIKAWESLPQDAPQKARLAGQIGKLQAWDLRWATGSIATSLAVYWGEELRTRYPREARQGGLILQDYVATGAQPQVLLDALEAASARLTTGFGTWKTPWGDVNRFQRLTGDIVQPFKDAGPSQPVAFTSAMWGSLASFGAKAWPATKNLPATTRRYGTSGNSFVAVVEFGSRVTARAVTAGGESGNPSSPHFNDQAERYSTGNLREVYFYPDQWKMHTERTYHPGK